VILASGFQDLTYEQYIAPNWPQLRVENLQAGYATLIARGRPSGCRRTPGQGRRSR
jgi:hypothetical protein